MDTRSKIITAARLLFWTKGYTATSVDAICNKAGVQKGSFYYYFDSKKKLALAVLDNQWTHARENLLEPSFSDGEDIQKQFARFFDKLYAEYRASQQQSGSMHGCPFGNFSGEVPVSDQEIQEKLNDIFGGFHQYFKKSLSCSFDEEKAALIADQVIIYFEGMMLLAKIRNDASVIKQMTPGVFQLLAS